MRKKILILIIVLFPSIFCYSQKDVIVLVDISKSIKQNDFVAVKQTVKNLLKGKYISPNEIKIEVDKKTTLNIGDEIPLFKLGDKLLIIPFGERKRFWDNTYNFDKVTDLDLYFENNYPKRVTDNKTYLELAKIKAANTAKETNVNNYILIMVSDNVNSNFGPNGLPNYTEEQSNSIVDFGTKSNPYLEQKHGTLIYKRNRNYKITISTVNIKDWKPYSPLGKPAQGGAKTETKCNLKFMSFANGIKGKEKIVKTNDIKLRWSANNITQGAKYKISISSTSGNRENNTSKSGLTNNYYSVHLANDTYRVSVTSTDCASDKTFIKVTSSNGGGGFLFLLILATAIGSLGYYLYKKNQDKKMEETQFEDSGNETDINYDGTDTNSNELDGF